MRITAGATIGRPLPLEISNSHGSNKSFSATGGQWPPLRLHMPALPFDGVIGGIFFMIACGVSFGAGLLRAQARNLPMKMAVVSADPVRQTANSLPANVSKKVI